MANKPTYEQLEQRVKELEEESVKRKQAEEAIFAERDTMINVFNSMEDGLYIVNQQNDIEYVNPALLKEFGPYEGKKCYEYFHDRKEVCPWCKNEDVFSGKTVRWEWYSSKNQKTYDLIGTPLKNPDGSISKLEILRDITEHKRAKEQIKQQSEFLNLVVEAIPHPFYVVDAFDYTIKMANSATHIGPLPKDATCYALTHKSDRPCESEVHPCPLEIVKETKQPVTVEHIHYDKDGRPRNVEIHAYPIFDSEGNVIQMIESSLDITDRKRAEEEREELIQELENALAKVKTLSGLLPICAACKRIRDDKGYWNQIEAYIRDHSEAEFSHSICPECAKKLYPEFYHNKNENGVKS